jgi:hypothetical protein
LIRSAPARRAPASQDGSQFVKIPTFNLGNLVKVFDMDIEAETAVRTAFREGAPHNVRTIPDRARRLLDDPAQGLERVARAIADLARRGALEAPAEPWKDWKLLD